MFSTFTLAVLGIAFAVVLILLNGVFRHTGMLLVAAVIVGCFYAFGG